MKSFLQQLCYCLIFSFCLLLFHGITYGQDSTKAEQQVWPELKFFYRLNNKFRIYSNVSGKKQSGSAYSDGSFGAYLDYFGYPIFKKFKTVLDSTRGYRIWARVGLLYSANPIKDDTKYREYTIRTELDNRFYLKWDMLLTWKNMLEWRFVNGDFRFRWRPRLTIDRDFKTEFLTFNSFIYGEYFVDFNSSTFNRFRFCMGTELRVTHNINFEVYYTHQFDYDFSSSSVDAIGLVIRAYFNRVKKDQDTK